MPCPAFRSLHIASAGMLEKSGLDRVLVIRAKVEPAFKVRGSPSSNLVVSLILVGPKVVWLRCTHRPRPDGYHSYSYSVMLIMVARAGQRKWQIEQAGCVGICSASGLAPLAKQGRRASVRVPRTFAQVPGCLGSRGSINSGLLPTEITIRCFLTRNPIFHRVIACILELPDHKLSRNG